MGRPSELRVALDHYGAGEASAVLVDGNAVVVGQGEIELPQHDATVGVADRLRRLAAEVAQLPVLDERTADEILGYDEHGLPS